MASTETDTGGGGTRRIGPYSVLERLGAGGMGEVFLAEQHEPIRRRVALKLIKLGMDSREIVARFEQERQALALMDHDGIARVYDCGTTERGQPYFVMELVKGVPITEYAETHRLSLEARLGLVRQVCAAVQHAHQKGVVHRDLKPTNVLVTEDGEEPQVKVIDFGLAKAMGAKLVEASLFTEVGQILGTPTYMAPEQADPTNLDVDTRADIYAIGVILYEILVGDLPFSGEELREAGFVEAQRILREVEPPKPSSRLDSSPDQGSSVAARRRCTVSTLRRAMRDDLDWVVLKALDKDRNRRYETASAMSADLGRFLEHEPLVAGPPSATYRLRKLLRRHRAQVVTVALVLTAILVGTVATFVQYRRAEDSARLALAEKAEAELEERRALAIKAFLLEDMMAEARPDASGKDVRVLDALNRARDEIDARFADDPLVLAAVQLELGQIYDMLGEWGDARPLFESSSRTLARLRGPEHVETLEASLALAQLDMDTRRLDEARAALEELGPIAARVAGPESTLALDAKVTLSLVLVLQGDSAAAEEEARQVLEARDDAARRASDVRALAVSLIQSGKRDEARARLDEAQELLRDFDELHPEVLLVRLTRAQLLADRYEWQRAEDMIREILPGLTSAYGPGSTQVALARMQLGHALRNRYQAREALVELEAARDVLKPTLGAENDTVLDLMNSIGVALMRIDGREQESIEVLTENLARRRAVHGDDSLAAAQSYEALGMVQARTGGLVAADENLGRAIAILERAKGEDHPGLSGPLSNHAGVLLDLGRFDEAVVALERVLATNVRELEGGAKNRYVLIDKAMLGRGLVGAGRAAEAEPYLLEARVDRVGVLDDSNRWWFEVDRWLAASLVAQRKFDEAEEIYLELFDRCIEDERKDVWVPEGIAKLYDASGREDEAEAFREEARAWGESGGD
ncbi:MAG: tetratricopeptide repeat protein [Planctomycetota bacterium]